MALRKFQVKTGFPSFTPLYRENGVVVKTYDTGRSAEVASTGPASSPAGATRNCLRGHDLPPSARAWNGST